MKKFYHSLCLLICFAAHSWAQCPTSTAGQLSGQWNTLLPSDTTAAPVYTINPSGLPNTEFLIIQNDELASDGFGPKIMLSSLDGRVNSNQLGLSTCNEICIVPFSYDISQLQTIVDTLYGGEYLPGTSCCAAADQFFAGICDSMTYYGINSGADISNLNDVITLMGLIAGTNNGSTSLFNLRTTIDQLNAFMTLFGPCSGGVAEICYAVADSMPAMDCYTVRMPNAASAINIVEDSLTMQANSSTQLNAAFTPSSAVDSIVWSASNSAVINVDANGLVTTGSGNDTAWIYATTINSCWTDSTMVLLNTATNLPSVAQQLSSVKIAPNPFEHTLNIHLNSSEAMLHLQLINMQGTLIQQQNIVPTQRTLLTIKSQNWPSGVYYLRITGEKTTIIKSIVKH